MADVATARRGDGRDDCETEPGDASVTGARSDWGRDESVAERDEDRAQLILITGLTLAVILVTVVLLLNTAIYTENLATRGVDAGGAEAIEFRDGAVDDLAGIMHREHRNESSDAGVEADFGASAETYARSVSTLRARDGTVADVDVSVTETGYFIAQNETDGGFRNMTASDGTTADWTVAGNATRTRNYRLTVDPDSLSDSQSGAFAVVADGSPHGTNATWSASLSRATGDELNVTVTSETDTVSETFETGPDGNHTVDLTGGTVNGEPFDALVWADGVQTGSDRYDVRYENGDRARGTYHLVVDDRDGGADLDRPSRPYVVDAVYSAEVDVYYHTPELEYGDSLRLAPGERDA
jgi:hypothetical protein